MCYRNSRVRRCGDAGGDARHHLESDARVRESLRLLAPAAENERIAALESNDALPLAGEADEERFDVFLARRALAATLAYEVTLGHVRDRAAREYDGIHQRVEHHRVAAREQIARTHREEPGVTRAGSHEMDHTCPLPAIAHPRKMSGRGGERKQEGEGREEADRVEREIGRLCTRRDLALIMGS
jgi:hypothetical protein